MRFKEKHNNFHVEINGKVMFAFLSNRFNVKNCDYSRTWYIETRESKKCYFVDKREGSKSAKENYLT